MQNISHFMHHVMLQESQTLTVFMICVSQPLLLHWHVLTVMMSDQIIAVVRTPVTFTSSVLRLCKNSLSLSHFCSISVEEKGWGMNANVPHWWRMTVNVGFAFWNLVSSCCRYCSSSDCDWLMVCLSLLPSEYCSFMTCCVGFWLSSI